MVRTIPDDDSDRKLLADIENHGWHLVSIEEDDEGPAYVFSVGLLHTLGHPEICIFGLNSSETMGQILNDIGSLIKTGEKFADWHASDDVLDAYSCIFRTVDSSHFSEYFGYAQWFYESDDFPMLQCVWPDRDHLYPWYPGFSADLLSRQPALAQTSDWLFLDPKNAAAITTKRILDDDHPILLVSHDAGGDWQFLCGTTNKTEDGRVVSLQTIAEKDPSVADLADLPVGWQAVRDSSNMPWKRMRG